MWLWLMRKYRTVYGIVQAGYNASMTTALTRIVQILPSLAEDEQESVLDYIELMRGKPVADGLSDGDRAELLRRAASAGPTTTVPLDEAMARARDTLAKLRS